MSRMHQHGDGSKHTAPVPQTSMGQFIRISRHGEFLLKYLRQLQHYNVGWSEWRSRALAESACPET